MNKKINVLTAVALASLLAACGGGGGGSTTPVASGSGSVTTPEPVVPVTPVVTPPVVAAPDTGVVASVVAANYAVGSEEAAAFNRLNAERSQCGFGLLTQSVQLDAAAKSHADYQILNNLGSHFEDQVLYPIGFTGAVPGDRATAKGYIDFGNVSDEISILSGTTNKVGFGELGMRNLLSAPYHLAGLLDGNKDVGISVRSANETSPVGRNTTVYLQIDASYKAASGKQLLAAGEVATYPCQGSASISRQLVNETPNPVPGRDLSTNPIGTPIYVATRGGTPLTISTASVRETATNTAVVLRSPITASNDPNVIYKTNEGYVAPDAPLKASTQYTVTVTGTANGAAFTKTFSFTTGA